MEVIEVTEREVEVIEVIERGPAGPTGATGPQGPAGAGGVTSVTGTAPIVSSGGTTPAISVTVGSAANTVCAGDDARLSDSRTPVSHSHGNITNGGLVGTTSGLPLKTGTGGIVEAGAFGTSAGQFAEGNDTRIANIRSASIDTRTNIGGAGGSINLSGSTEDDGGNNYGFGGSINLSGGRAGTGGNGGSILAVGNQLSGGSINLSAATGAGSGGGGSITATGVGNESGGSLNMNGGSEGGGGSINTSNDGGSINTGGTGSIELGVTGTRTTLTGTATANRAISLPNATGTLALTQQATDYEVTDETKGVIMKSPNGTRWRVTIDNNGTMLRTAIALLLSAFLMCGAQAQVRDLVYGTNNVVIGPTNTNALSFTNRVSLPISSGAATTNSLLTADGAGGSAFVVSRTVTKFTTNDQTKTNWGFNAATQTNNNDTQMGSWALDANSMYRVEYAVAWVATTNSGLNHALGFSTNLSEFNQRSGVGQAANTTVTAINVGTNGTSFALPSGSAVATGGRFAVGGFIYLLTSSNANTMTYRWYPINNSADATTLIRSSMVSVTKMSP